MKGGLLSRTFFEIHLPRTSNVLLLGKGNLFPYGRFPEGPAQVPPSKQSGSRHHC